MCVAAGLVAAAGAVGPEFEVASVKPAAPGQRPLPGDCTGTLVGGQFHCASVTLKPLLLLAFGLKSYQFEGPGWLDSERYSIVAKAPSGAGSEQLNAMLQNLLASRFGMVVHWESREMAIYELVVAKGGLKMKEAEKAPAGAEAQPEPAANGRPPAPQMTHNKDGLPEFPPGVPGMFATAGGTPPDRFAWVTARMQTIGSLLNMLQFQIGRPVVDKTGLTGIYDFNLRYEGGSAASPSADAASDPEPTLFEAFEKQLGLRFEAKKGPVEVLVVDKVNRTPTEN
jgi:uncharacterized protein (TIGR03435 family)